MTSATTTATTSTVRVDLLAGLDAEVGVMVRRIRRVIAESARRVHPDLSSSGYLLLAWLTRNGPQRGSTIADQLGIDKGAISRQAQHLLELGLLERTPDPDDGRATLLSPSPVAVTGMARVREERREFLDQRLADWSDADLTTFVVLLGRYNAALD